MISFEEFEMCYAKLKKYYYDNNGLLFNKRKIACFECTKFNYKMKKIYDAFYNDRNRYLNSFINKTSIVKLPKNAYYSYGNKKTKKTKGRMLDFKYNFFIDIPVEIMILDVLFTCEFAKFISNKIPNASNYNNLLDFDINDPYSNNNLFSYYLNGYNNWKNDSKVQASMTCSTVLKTDIKDCFYNIDIDYDKIIIDTNDSFEIKRFLEIYRKISNIYSSFVLKEDKKRTNGECLPVGLFSSHMLFEYFIREKIDKKISNHNNLHLFRYCDDMVFVFNNRKFNREEAFIELNDIFTTNEGGFTFINDTNLFLRKNKTTNQVIEMNDPYLKYNLNALFKKNTASETNIIEFELNEKPKYDSNGNEIDSNILYKAKKIRDIYLQYRKVDNDDSYVKKFIEDASCLFSSYKLINYRGSWITLFEYLLLIGNNKEKEFVDNFYNKGIKMIDKKAKKYGLNVDLKNEFEISYELAKASFNIKDEDNLIYIKTSMFKPLETKLEVKFEALRKKNFCPYYISEDEKIFYKYKNPWYDDTDETLKIGPNFKNYLKDDTLVKTISISNNHQKGSVGISVANIRISKKEIKDDLDKDYRDFNARKDFLELLNNIKNNYKKFEINYLLLPEFYLDYNWIIDVIKFCKKTGITVISGMMLKKRKNGDKKQIINNLYCIIPYGYDGQKKIFRNVYIDRREKNNYSPEEEMIFISMNAWYRDHIQEYHLFKINNFVFSPMLCYEFTSPKSRNYFRGVVEAIFVPEVNADTKYFSSIVHSTSRDNHIYIIQANSSIYGDTRITQPKSVENMDLVSVKGGNNCTVHYSSLDLDGLLKIEKDFENKFVYYKNRIKEKNTNSYSKKSDFKIPSADFRRIAFEDYIKKLDNENKNTTENNLNDIPF